MLIMSQSWRWTVGGGFLYNRLNPHVKYLTGHFFQSDRCAVAPHKLIPDLPLILCLASLLACCGHKGMGEWQGIGEACGGEGARKFGAVVEGVDVCPNS